MNLAHSPADTTTRDDDPTRSPTPVRPGRPAIAAAVLFCGAVILACAALLSTGAGSAQATAERFLDVLLGHYYFEPIQGLAEAGVIDGYPVDGGSEFRPDNNLWRAQFAKMILGVLHVDVSEEAWQDSAPPFEDMGPDPSDDLYPHDYVAEAARLGITFGTSATRFSPYDDITRAQMVSMVVRAGRALKPGSLADIPASYRGSLLSFGSPDHAINMRTAEYNGLLAGLRDFGPNWDPWARATRAEAARVMWNLSLRESAPPPVVLLADDFSDSTSGWRSESNANSAVGYVDGQYEIALLKADWLRWTSIDFSVTDATVEVDARPRSTSVPTEYGLVLRMVDDADFYLLSVTSTGHTRLWLRKGGAWEALTPELAAPMVRKGASTNHLRVTCRAGEFTVAINHVVIGTFSDPSFDGGQVGLYAGSSPAGPASVWFDNFKVTEPLVE